MLSGIQRAAQAVLGVYLKRTCSRDTIHYHHRRHTTMSTVDSTPPEVSDGTRGIVSRLVEPLVPVDDQVGDATCGQEVG